MRPDPSLLPLRGAVLPTRPCLHLRLPTPGTLPESSPGPDVAASLRRRIDEFCAAVTPRWRVDACGVTVDLGGLGRLHGVGVPAAEKLCAAAAKHFSVWSAGWGPSPLVARLASRRAGQWGQGRLLAVPPGNVSVFLESVPVEAQPLGEGLHDRLHLLGVHTLGDLQMVPQDLLLAVFGEEGRLLHRAAFGHEDWGGRKNRPDSRPVLVARARWPRPLDAPEVRQALWRGLALRGLTWSQTRPPGRYRWRLELRRAGGPRQKSTSVAEMPGDVGGWVALVTRLWQPLSQRRTGLLEVALFGAVRGAGQDGQLDLFPDRNEAEELGRTLGRIRRRLDPHLRTAGEILLERWGVRWEGEAGSEGGGSVAG